MPNNARMTRYYAPIPILKMLNNPKTPQIHHPRWVYRVQELKIAKAPNLVKNLREHDGSNWSYWTYNDVEYDENYGFITQCTPAYKNIKVDIGGSETC